MVTFLKENNQGLYKCGECGFKYRERELAEKCERWCKEYNSCNMEITKHAVVETRFQPEGSSKRKEYEQRKRKKEQERRKVVRKIKVKGMAQKAGIVVLAAVLLGGGAWFLISRAEPQTGSSLAVLSTGGIHWHPHLSITILGEEQEISANLGIGFSPRPGNIHTHDTTGTLHLEFQGRVTEDNVRVKEFFKVWGKSFNSDCIFGYCGGEQGEVRMFVNGEQNFEFENYVMRDGDRIEIVFE